MRQFLTLAAFLLLYTMRVGTGTASAAAALSEEEGRPIIVGRAYQLQSPILGDKRVINVSLPEHYNDPKRSFPLLILLDGGEHEDFVHIAGLAQINAAYGNGQEVILIGVEGVDRRHDLTSPSSAPADQKVAPNAGGAVAYRRFLEAELKPWAVARYRTNGRTALMGESLAGLFVLDTFLDQTASFSDYISVSPSLWWDDGRLARETTSKLRRLDASNRNLWIAFDVPAPPEALARKERQQQRLLKRALRAARNPQLSWSAIRLDETHGEIFHPAALLAFRALFGKRTETRR